MKKLLAMLVFATMVMCANAQNTRWMSSNVRSQEKLQNGTWSKWTDWTESETLMILNPDELIMTIYLPDEMLEIELLGQIQLKPEQDESKRICIKGVMDEDEKCIVYLITKKNGNEQIMIELIDLRMLWNVKRRDNSKH